MGEYVEITHKSVVNQVTIQDNVSVYRNRYLPVTSEVTILDSVSASVQRPRGTAESISIGDAPLSSLTLTRIDVDTITISDIGLGHISTPKNISSSISISDIPSYYIYDSTGKVKSIIEISDRAQRTVAFKRESSDTVEISELTIPFLANRVSYTAQDIIEISDSGLHIIFKPILSSNVSELTIQDTITSVLRKYAKISTTVEVGESVSTVINNAGSGSVIHSTEDGVNILEAAKAKIYEFKTSPEALGEIYNEYNTPKYSNVFVDFLYTTSLVPYAYSSIILGYNTVGGELLGIYKTAYNFSYNYHEVLPATNNIHQIKTNPEDAELQFGVIREDTEKDFSIISGEPENLIVESILIPEWFGVELIGLSVGDTLVAGSTIEFVVLAHTDVGRPEVEDFLTIHFVGDQKIKIWIQLIRVQVFDYFITPDAGSYSESLNWHTIFFESISNVRKSKVMMELPKWEVKYSVTAFQTAKHRAFINIFREGLTQPMLHPLWGHSAFIDYSEDGTYSINMDWEFMDIEVGDTLFVFRTVDEYRLAKVVGLSPGWVLLDKKFDIEPGYIVCPSFIGIVTGTVDTNYIGERQFKGTISVKELVVEP